jgi:hypothetical protein
MMLVIVSSESQVLLLAWKWHQQLFYVEECKLHDGAKHTIFCYILLCLTWRCGLHGQNVFWAKIMRKTARSSHSMAVTRVFCSVRVCLSVRSYPNIYLKTVRTYKYSQYSFVSSYFVTINFLCSVLNIFIYFILFYFIFLCYSIADRAYTAMRTTLFSDAPTLIVISPPILDRFVFRDNQPKAMASICWFI